jgi:hypothetical protein
MVAPRRLHAVGTGGVVALSGRDRRSVVLERKHHLEVVIERQARAVPRESVDPVAEKRDFEHLVAVREPGDVVVRTALLLGSERIGVEGRGGSARPIQVDARIGREIRMKGDPEEAAFGEVVDRQVEDRRGRTVLDPQDLATVLLEDEQVVRPDERDARRQGDPAGVGRDPQVRVDDGRTLLRDGTYWRQGEGE